MARKNVKGSVQLGLWVEGGSGDDVLSGTAGRDTFVLRANSGHDVVSNYGAAEHDNILLDSQTGVYDGMLGSYWGPLYDGQVFYNSHGTYVATVHEGDFNGDGITDTQFAMESSSLTLLSVSASEIMSYSILGG